MLEFAQQIADLTGRQPELRFTSLLADDPKQRRPDNRRAREFIEFEPLVQLREGLSRTIADFAARLAVSRYGSPSTPTALAQRREDRARDCGRASPLEPSTLARLPPRVNLALAIRRRGLPSLPGAVLSLLPAPLALRTAARQPERIALKVNPLTANEA